MPTGYTAEIAQGIDFKTFVMHCARAMGALVTMRDAPMDAPIPERFEPNDYHLRTIAAQEADLAKVRAMSEEEAEAAAREFFDKESRANASAIEEYAALRGKYEAMLAQVEVWQPPTPEHEGFKQFMVDQLRRSIDGDCMEGFYRDLSPQQKSGKQWRAEQIDTLTHGIAYHTEQHAEEVERTEARNRWLSSLRTSLA